MIMKSSGVASAPCCNLILAGKSVEKPLMEDKPLN